MKMYLLLFLLISFSAAAQKEVRMAGDTTNEKFMNSVQKLRDQGWNVKIVSQEEIEKRSNDKRELRDNYVGRKLPDFTLTDVNGNTIHSSDLKGKIVHINFWSITCGPCIEEFPELNELKEKYADSPAIFLAIAPESIEKVERVITKHPLDYTIVAEADAYFNELGIKGYPVNFFVKPDGTIMDVIEGSNYKGEVIDGKMEMVPNNLPRYDQMMKELQKSL
jgi:peroxiredoxin